MKKFCVKLNCGNFAVIQSFGFPQEKQVTARIGIILPGRKVIEFFKLNDWDFSYEGNNQKIKNNLHEIYSKNRTLIKNWVISLKPE